MNQSDQNKSYTSELVKLAKYNLIACGYEKLTVSTVKSLTVPTNAKYAMIYIESDVTDSIVVRYLELGTVTLPTATDGFPRSHGELFDVQGYQNLINLRLIQTQAGTHLAHICYYK
jgi:hypothetical protein